MSFTGIGEYLASGWNAVPRLHLIHKSQVLSYLKTMDLKIGVVINFSSRLLKEGFKRVVR